MYDVFLRFPEFKAKAVTFSYDDGIEQDERLIQILNKNGLKGTFNINTGLMAPEGTLYPKEQLHRRLPESKIRSIYSDGGHELACHSLHHKYMDTLNECELIFELAEDKKKLEEITGKIIRGFAVPYGRSSEKLMSALSNLDFIYSRGVGSTMTFTIPENLLNIIPTCRHSDQGIGKLVDCFLDDSPLSNFHDRHPWLFYMWGHAYEFERDNSWELIEDLSSKLGRHDDVWYATNNEVFSYISDYRRLIYSANGELVFNPTSSTLWLESDGKMFTVAPGETRSIRRLPVEEFVHLEK